MRKHFILFFLSSTMFAQKMEFRELNKPGTALKGISNKGDAIMIGYSYEYKSNTLIPIEDNLEKYASMNEKGDILAIGTLNGKLQPVYKKSGTSEWLGTGYFSDNSENSATPYFISENGRFITGQMNNIPFLYDTELKKIINLKPDKFQYGAGYSVNNNGTAVGWLDQNINGTFRELAVMPIDKEVEIILPEYAVPVNNHIWHIDNNQVVVGDVGLKPFIYDLNKKEYKIFDLPVGYRTGTFMYSSNGISIGFAQNMVADREAIIYHKSLGDQPKLIKDLLLEQGIEITIPGGKLGTASVISENGDFIGGNEIGNGNIAAGWILKLNGYFDTKECKINIPSDIEIQTMLGETSAIVNYEVTTDCLDYKLVRVKGFESGSEFPIGLTTVAYNLLNSEGEIINSASFKVLVKDSYCTPRFTAIVEPITKVKIGSIDNTTSNHVTSNENEYFLDQFTDLVQGKKYEITVAGNTNGNSVTSEFVVFFDFNQDGIFDSDTEGYYIGSITGSTGIDGKTVTNSITIPDNVKLGKTRMRVMKTYRLVPDNPCSLTYAYGQSEDYSVNFTSNLGTSNLNSKTLRIYPTPVRDILKIDTKSIVKSIKIINMVGEEIYKKQLNKMNPQINVSNLSKGIYFINVEIDGEIISQKFIKH